jgi:hypothetical protein
MGQFPGLLRLTVILTPSRSKLVDHTLVCQPNPSKNYRVYADFRKSDDYFNTGFELILSLYQISPQHPVASDLRKSLGEKA